MMSWGMPNTQKCNFGQQPMDGNAVFRIWSKQVQDAYVTFMNI